MMLLLNKSYFERDMIMKNSKAVKKSVAVAMAVAVGAVMTVTSVACAALSANQGADNKAYLDDAKGVVSSFVNSASLNSFEFTNDVFAKANVVSASVNEQTSAEAVASISSNLGLNSFEVTDAEGKIINSTDAGKIGKSYLDDESTKQFKKVLNGNCYKITTEPTAVDGEDGVYNLQACVTRSQGGMVIIDLNTDTYQLVTGKSLADSCKGDTIIAKDGEIVSTSFESTNSDLKGFGITDDMLKSDSFTISVNDKAYTLSATTVEGYTVISGAEKTDGNFNLVYGAVIPCVAFVVMSALSIAVITVTSKKD